MNPGANISAAAASDAYKDRPGNISDNKPVYFDGHEYHVFGYKEDPSTGFHGTAYQNAASGEVVIAYRGKEYRAGQDYAGRAKSAAGDGCNKRHTVARRDCRLGISAIGKRPPSVPDRNCAAIPLLGEISGSNSPSPSRKPRRVNQS